ncbi:MAG: hypothetical protein Q7S40_29160 [Opitutaceae bacterium]|nr:hypothetical protein [Opitutaceae bacterium]
MTSGKIPWHEPDLLPLLPPGVTRQKPFTVVDLLAKVRRFLTPTDLVAE